MPDQSVASGAPWWQAGVLYQVYVRSFADSDGDGVGDLQGVIDHLDHLHWLGVDGIWLSPVTVSPDSDWGYDVTDYCAIQPALGTFAEFDALVGRAHVLGMRVLVDFVPNHTSDRHPWFVDARSSRTARHRDWYVWADPGPDGAPPNNWVSSFGGSAWTLEHTTGQYYLHNHLVEQPDLNWWNDDVRAEFDDIARFWFDRGVDGFRIDVCNVIVKDARLRDNPPASADDPLDLQLLGQRPVFNANRPEVHDVVRRWRWIADTYEPPRVLLGETPVESEAELAKYYGTGSDALHLAFNFPFITAPLDAGPMAAIVERIEAALPSGAWPAWTGSNHDIGHFSTRWAGDDERKVRVALLVLLGLRGTPVLYQGDEIGLGDVSVEPPNLRDPLGVAYWPAYAGRDGARTPMPWRAEPGGGFTRAGVEPWLPLGDTTRSVEQQRADPNSVLVFVHDLIAFRRHTPDLATGPYAPLEAPPGVWAWRRGEQHAVVVNTTDGTATVTGIVGTIAIATDRARDGKAASESVSLPRWSGVVVALE